ncbi:MAG TPA: ABC transporter ATP-binding protein [Victivallales bacterium]|nr:ABC transporter ATP-binding protein [Victivallales bacterium]HPO89971.1 ABC transporter ATP-binding protein [Victivallales bacterium]HRR06250.1 ABC transporter ATP-binding protein [Victivallales bacterium]HRR28470.1 ABC transporter ATP-binding protein [Victivallales bacterium]
MSSAKKNNSDSEKKIPEFLLEAFKKYHPKEKILFYAESDISNHRKFGNEWLVVSDNHITVFQKDSSSIFPSHDIKITSIKKAKISPQVGSMSIIIEPKHGSNFKLISFSQSLNQLFALAVDNINALVENLPLVVTGGILPSLCPSCNNPIPPELNKCPRCTDRKNTLLRISQFTRPYRMTLVLILLVMILSTAFGLLTPYMSKVFIDVIFKKDPVTGNFTNSLWLGPAALTLLFAYAMQMFLSGIQERLSGSLGFRTVADVRQKLYDKLQELSLAFFDKHQTGALLSRVNQDTQEMQRLLVDFIPVSIESLFMFIGIGIFLFILSWELTIFILIPIVCIVFFVKTIIPKMWIFFHRFFHRRSKLSAVVADSISGIRVVKAFGQESYETKKFKKYSLEYRDSGIELVKKWSLFHPLFHLLIMSGMVIVWYVGGKLVFSGKMTLGSVVAYSGYLMMFYRPIFMLVRMLDMISNALSAAERVFDIMDCEPLIKDSSDAIPLTEIEGKIEFKNVSFGYDKFRPVIKNLSLNINPNEMIGLVGRSGAGKSTMINLICRLYDPDKGEILLDGKDLRKIKQSDLRSKIGIVLQDSFLFNGTIFENILYSKPNATREEVISAAIAANAHEFIIKKPDAYDTEVGERGNNLSGGEKQRISIARAILRNPNILILDEATSSVDTQTEKKIQEAIEKLIKGRTTIAIAHRLSTLRKCDRIIVMKNGEIAETGTHKELMEKKGLFYELVKIQSEMSKIILTDDTNNIAGMKKAINGKSDDYGNRENGESNFEELQ